MIQNFTFIMKFSKPGIILLTIIIINLLSSCTDVQNKKAVKILISKEKANKADMMYSDWLKRHGNVNCLYAYPMGIDSALKVLSESDGLLITGGRDVFPGNYGKIDDTSRCGSFDRYRDSLEFSLINMAIENKIPLLGVCRGEQIINVSQGGTLYIDIPTDFDTTVTHRLPGYQRAVHKVNLLPGSMISQICDVEHGDVVSNHHQGIELAGDNIRVTAYSADSLPEAIEWNDTTGLAMMIAVQWHPETMDIKNPLSAMLAKKFLNQASADNE